MKPQIQLRTLACAALLLLAPVALACDATLTPEMVVDLASVSEVALAPGGRTVAYTLQVPRAADDDPGSSYKQLWLADTETGTLTRLIHDGDVHHPVWGPDGKQVLYLDFVGNKLIAG